VLPVVAAGQAEFVETDHRLFDEANTECALCAGASATPSAICRTSTF